MPESHSVRPAVSFETVSKSFGSFIALDQVSFSIETGDFFALLGPNGAGKTTLISIVTGLLKPTEGDVIVAGTSITKDPLAAKKKIGVVPQEVVSSGFFNLEELLTYHSGYYGLKNNNDRIQNLLKRLSLKEHSHKMMRQLSGGMKRRMMIAKALVHSPKVLLLDEPTAGVDVELRNQLWEFVRELQKEGVSIVLTTHYLQEAEALCDRVGIINKGELKYVGQTREIIQQLTQKKVQVTVSGNSAPVEFFLGKDDNLGVALRSRNISMDSIHDLKTTEGSLEEAFVKVLKL